MIIKFLLLLVMDDDDDDDDRYDDHRATSDDNDDDGIVNDVEDYGNDVIDCHYNDYYDVDEMSTALSSILMKCLKTLTSMMIIMIVL